MTCGLQCSACYGASAMMVSALIASACPLHCAWLCWCLAPGSIKAVYGSLLTVSVSRDSSIVHCCAAASGGEGGHTAVSGLQLTRNWSLHCEHPGFKQTVCWSLCTHVRSGLQVCILGHLRRHRAARRHPAAQLRRQLDAALPGIRQQRPQPAAQAHRLAAAAGHQVQLLPPPLRQHSPMVAALHVVLMFSLCSVQHISAAAPMEAASQEAYTVL